MKGLVAKYFKIIEFFSTVFSTVRLTSFSISTIYLFIDSCMSHLIFKLAISPLVNESCPQILLVLTHFSRYDINICGEKKVVEH